MGKITNEHNPPDHDQDPPPSYDESENAAYNPRFVQGNASTSSPPPIEHQQSHLYPTVPPPPTAHPPVAILQPQQHSGSYYHYQTFPVATQQRYHYQGRPIIRDRIYVNTAERRFPTAIIFFVLGWVCPLLWFMGACCCAGRRNPYESFWGKANAVMGVLFILSSILYSMIAVTVDDWSVGLRLFYTFSTA
ncbi:hypothetical protein K492DRAFT_205502 [Lichtheimia hyalospora FSU 10163]|nr:hypothetical protein K492DRAFT_205502 [Lichtheimia hyalospora FSU 10163]